MSQEELMAAVVLDNDRAGEQYRKLLDCKVKMFQAFCDCIRPGDGVQLLKKPAGGWRAIPVATLIGFIEMVGDGEVPKGGFVVDAGWKGANAHTPKARGCDIGVARV